jgi:hypothetical protein
MERQTAQERSGVWSAETVFVCPLGLPGRGQQTFLPVEFVDELITSALRRNARAPMEARDSR